MKRLNAAVRIGFSLTTMFALVFSSQAQQQRSSAHVIHIVDQNGQPAASGVPSGGGQIVDVAVGQNGLTFTPSTVNISVGDTVRWTWATGGHSVTSGDPCTPDGEYCSPDDMNCDQGILSGQGTVYSHTFAQAGTFNYFCHAHCNFGMTGVVNVAAAPTPTPTPPTPTPTPIVTPSPTPSVTPPVSPTPIPTATPSVTPPASPTPTPSATPTPGRRRPTPRPRPTPHLRP